MKWKETGMDENNTHTLVHVPPKSSCSLYPAAP